MDTSKFRRRISRLCARAGIWLLKRSGLYDSYYSGWRGDSFDRAEELGIHILPVHYYSPIPILGQVKPDDQTKKFQSAQPKTLDSALEDFVRLADLYRKDFQEIQSRRRYNNSDKIEEFRFGLAPYSTVEAEALYGLIRSEHPSQIVEIGCGHTTLLISEAIKAEKPYGYAPIYTCIEPYRPSYLKTLPTEVTIFFDQPLQSVSMDEFRRLRSGDILFIDSTHVAKYGSDVVYELTSILPNLQSGVRVHFHDIFLPYDYPNDWLTSARFFWNEQYMLEVMLRDNPRYRVVWPIHQLFRERNAELSQIFPLVVNPSHRPGAFWIEVA